MVEAEAHDEVVEWFDSLTKDEWERVPIIVDRLVGVACSDAVVEESR